MISACEDADGRHIRSADGRCRARICTTIAQCLPVVATPTSSRSSQLAAMGARDDTMAAWTRYTILLCMLATAAPGRNPLVRASDDQDEGTDDESEALRTDGLPRGSIAGNEAGRLRRRRRFRWMPLSGDELVRSPGRICRGGADPKSIEAADDVGKVDGQRLRTSTTEGEE